MVKLDKNDWKILYELNQNARQTTSAIAKKIGLSTQLVDYRIKRLEKNSTIKSYLTFIDNTKIGYLNFKIYLKLQHIDEQKINEIIHHLKQNPYILMLSLCDGPWDLFIGIWGKNLFHAINIFEKINKKYSYYFHKKSIIINTKCYWLTRKFLAPQDYPTKTYEQIWGGKPINNKTDTLDRQILSILSQNARITNTEIARKLHILREVVSYRIKNYHKKNILYGSTIVLNIEQLHIQEYKLLIKTQSLTPTIKNKLLILLKKHPYVSHIFFCIGEWDLEIYIETPSIEINHELIRQLRYQFGDVIRDLEVIRYYKNYTLNWFPEGLSLEK